MISIFNKELRDCLKWVPAGILITLVMTWNYLLGNLGEGSSVEPTLMSAFGWSAAMIAFSLGLLQSLFDIRNDARGYLLHRPVRRSDIFWAKLASGFVAYVLALAPGVLAAAIYFNSKGLEFLPVSPLQVIPGVLLSLAVFLLHPIAMWIGNRDAKWVGTRVLPLAGIVPILFWFYTVYETDLGRYHRTEIQRILFTVAVWALHIVSIVIVLIAARHAFCNRQMLPPASGKNASSWASILGLTFSSIVLATAGISFTIEALSRVEPNFTTRQLLMNSAGDFQQVSIERNNWNWEDATFSVRPAAESSADFLAVDDQWKLAEYSVVPNVRRHRYSWFYQFKGLGGYGTGSPTRGPVELFSHKGCLLAYERGHLKAIVTPQGVSRDGEMAQDRFENLGVVSYPKSNISGSWQLAANPLVMDAIGMVQFDSDTFEMHRLIEADVDRVCMLYADGQYPASLWTVSDGTVTQHEISAADGETELSEKALVKNHKIDLPILKIDSVKEYKIDLPDELYSISVFRGDDGQYGYVTYTFSNREHFYGMLSDDGSVSQVGPVVVPASAGPQKSAVVLGIPPIAACVVGVVAKWVYGVFPADGIGILAMLVLAQALMAAGGTFMLCKWMDLTNRQCWIWTVVALFCGWGIWLAVVACYRRLVKEACPHCQKRARVDQDTCTHCNQPWLPPELDHIEIFDGGFQAA